MSLLACIGAAYRDQPFVDRLDSTGKDNEDKSDIQPLRVTFLAGDPVIPVINPTDPDSDQLIVITPSARQP